METKTYLENELSFVIDDLKADQVVALATDTVMGLVAKADSLIAFQKLRQLKGARENKAFPVMVADFSQLKDLVKLTNRDLILVKKWFPGAVTFVFNKNKESKIISLDNTVAVRMPKDKLLLKVVSKLGKPVFLTSANKSSQPTTMKAKEVLDIFDGEIKSVVMRDALGYQASTIIDASGDKLKLLRAGSISLKEIIESLEDIYEKNCNGK